MYYHLMSRMNMFYTFHLSRTHKNAQGLVRWWWSHAHALSIQSHVFSLPAESGVWAVRVSIWNLISVDALPGLWVRCGVEIKVMHICFGGVVNRNESSGWVPCFNAGDSEIFLPTIMGHVFVVFGYTRSVVFTTLVHWGVNKTAAFTWDLRPCAAEIRGARWPLVRLPESSTVYMIW